MWKLEYGSLPVEVEVQNLRSGSCDVQWRCEGATPNYYFLLAFCIVHAFGVVGFKCDLW